MNHTHLVIHLSEKVALHDAMSYDLDDDTGYFDLTSRARLIIKTLGYPGVGIGGIRKVTRKLEWRQYCGATPNHGYNDYPYITIYKP
jgi:hypothetical protein